MADPGRSRRRVVSQPVRAKAGDPLWLILLPPLITAVVGLILVLRLGTGGWIDAQIWPSNFRATTLVPNPHIGGGICRAFVFSTALLVVLNNVILYLREIHRVGEEARPDSPRGRWARSAAFWLASLATLTVFFWLVDTVISIIPATTTKHELFAFVAFTLFAIIDYMLSNNARETAADEDNHAKRDRLEAEADYYGLQASYTDTAVVVGMLVLLAVKYRLSHLPAFNQHFEWGFVTGAIGMHLAYSQFVFLALTLRHRKRIKQIFLEEIAAATPDELENKPHRAVPGDSRKGGTVA